MTLWPQSTTACPCTLEGYSKAGNSKAGKLLLPDLLGAGQGMRILPFDRIRAVNGWGEEKRFLKGPDTLVHNLFFNASLKYLKAQC